MKARLRRRLSPPGTRALTESSVFCTVSPDHWDGMLLKARREPGSRRIARWARWRLDPGEGLQQHGGGLGELTEMKTALRRRPL